MASDLEKIGLEAVMLTAAFQAGVKEYLDSIGQMESETDKAAKASADATEKQAKRQEQALKKVGIAFAAVGAAGVALLGKLALTASRTEELGVILDVTAENARRLAEEQATIAEQQGDQAAAAEAAARAASLNAQAVDEQVVAVKGLGITTQAASKTVALLIRYNLDWKRSTELAALAQDAATFAAQDSSEALDGLIHGITTLNPRVLRQYGILVNLEQEYSKFAETTGKTTSDITDLEKQQIAFNAVMRQAPSIAGAYEAAMNTASKQIRSLTRDVSEVSEEFGAALTPALTSAVGALRDFLGWLRDLPDPVQETAVQALAMATGISTMVGAAALAIPKIQGMIAAIKELTIVTQLASVGMLGPAGIVAGLTAAAGVAILYANNLEKAKREEAASTLETAESYQVYIDKLDESGIAAYGLTQALYDLVKAQEASAQAAFAQGLVDAQQDLEGLVYFINEATGQLETFNAEGEKVITPLTDFQLIVLQDEAALDTLGRRLGKQGAELIAWKEAMQAAAQATEEARAQTELYNQRDQIRYQQLTSGTPKLEASAQATEDAATATSRYTGALDDLSPALQDARLEQEFLNAAQLVGARIQADLAAEIEANAKDAARATIDAEKQAAGEREAARAQLLESQVSLEEDHSEAVSKLLKDLADVDKDLLRDRVKAEEDAVKDRIDAYDELGAALTAADEKLNREREEAHTDYLQKLADLDRKYAQDVEDINRDLARDLEDIEQDHLDKLAALDRDYYRDREQLAEEHGKRVANIEEKYANEAAAIRAKFRGDAGERDFDAEREALQKQLDALKNQRGIDYTQQRADIQKQLDALEAEELAALEERKQAELDEQAKWLEAEQAQQDQAYQDAITAENDAYAKRKADRQAQYDERLQDLKIQLDREQEAARISRERALADLQTAHEQEKAEAQRRYQERLAEIDAQLEQEKQRLDAAAEQERAKLREQLAAEDQSYKDRFAKLEEAHQKRIEEIDRALEAEKTEIATKAAEATLLYIQELEGLGPEARRVLEQQATDDLAPAMQKWVDVFADARRRAAEQIQGIRDDAARILETGSPSKWAERMAEAIGSGWEQGDSLGPALATMLDQIKGFKTDAGAALSGLKAPQPEQVVPVASQAAQAEQGGDLARLLFSGVGQQEAPQVTVAAPAAAPARAQATGEPIVLDAPALAPPQVSLAAPEVTYQPPALPQMGGMTSTTIQNESNYNLSADFSNSNLYPRIRDQFILMEMGSAR